MKDMNSKDVVDIYEKLENLGIKIWIDGGWAVDALLGEVTREHSDLDLAVERKNLTKLREYLEAQGYREIERAEDKKWDFVLGDDFRHEIDVHAFSFDENGDVVEEKDDWAGFEKDSLTGAGIIDGKSVRCVSLKYILKTHDVAMRELKESDKKDMEALKNKFEI